MNRELFSQVETIVSYKLFLAEQLGHTDGVELWDLQDELDYLCRATDVTQVLQSLVEQDYAQKVLDRSDGAYYRRKQDV